ncbi:MAG: DUF4251 domain-containing protein [Bacteroidales bacterium]|jgi:hypothetical protein|nr:DUF4251 domain-containing protein [Bacteroidales bacterium]
MKQTIIYLFALIISASCTSVREARTEAASQRSIREEQTRIAIDKAVASGNFQVRMERLDGFRGQTIHLAHGVNYLVIDRGILRLKLGYIGRQYTFRPISAINMTARPSEYEMSRNPRTGNYEIEIKVSQAGEPFNIYLNINQRGICTTHISNPKIQTVRYTGRITIPENLANR